MFMEQVQPGESVLTREEVLAVLSDALPELRQRFAVTRLAIFGSAARGDSTPDSDVDILVETDRPLGFAFVDLAIVLEERIGRPVDLATFDSFRETAKNPRRQAMIKAVEKDLTDVDASTR
jgi:predicted nucleotidyltransferase